LEPAQILLVSNRQEDHLILPGILDHPHWEWQHSHGCAEALELIRKRPFAVVICERDQTGGCWRDILRASSESAASPSLLVCSRLSDDSLWAEVLNLGGYDVLVKPFDSEEVLRVGFLAWHYWKRRPVAAAVSASGKAPTPSAERRAAVA